MLNDKAIRIFLNTKGRNAEEVPEELVKFLRYVEHTTDEAAAESGSERIMRIHNRVCKVKTSEEVGVKYMQAWEEKYYEREEAREEGREEGIKQGEVKKLYELVEKKLKKGKSEEQIADELEESEEVIGKLIADLEEAKEGLI